MNRKRLEKIIKNMEKYNIPQMIITSSDSIFYLLGEWIHPGERMLALYINTDGNVRLFINELFPITKDLGIDICIHKDTDDPIEQLAKIIDKNKVVGIDKEWPSHFLISLLKEKEGLKVENGSIVVDEARMIKDEKEIELMKKASAINDKAMEEIIEFIKGGCSEIEATKKLSTIYSKYGSHSFAFNPIICYGENAADPHYIPNETELQKNNCIIIDIGCIKNGYASDMTRSLFYGQPDDEYRKIYDLVYKANLEAIESVKPGVKFSDIDRAARKVIEDGGYGEYFIHRTGHNIGINVHEYPDVSSSNDMEIIEGMVFSIEPGIYLQGKYGVRIEDLVVVTKDGCEVLNKFSKDLIVFS
ncbi:M24 family metallopeptidase [Thermohalobacter berrensis]|uniref:Proline dipeptidase n=1 Tax=Thermohalobacter berrensis TaxID=99594 RepID=A0A419T891_9FIRM|nr:Xaa-Pro peptidase family protein [Thermohalobacter berrensis]RKD33807.1 proline dipeptidase [Thermohalobacter berrensis]